MKIISTFPYSEPHELDVLLVKMHTEDKGVAEWVVCENDYTFTGEYKGFNAQESILKDPRFEKFLNKITLIQKSFRLDMPETQEDFRIGDAQRDFGTEYILSNYTDDDTWVMPSDVDQAIDFTGSNRTDFIYESIKNHSNDLVVFSLKKNWFDYDNYSSTQHQFPAIPLSWIRGGRYPIHEVPHLTGRPHLRLTNPFPRGFCIYEYSYCYTFDKIKRKLDTFGHFPFTESDIEIALKCNHWIVKGSKGIVVPSPSASPICWFGKEELNSDNSPPYVLENIETLRTNIVNPNYIENRKVFYPQYFS